MEDLNGCVYVVFTRIPVPGRVKTRLEPCLHDDGCADIQEAMVLDLLEELSGAGNPVVLFYSDEWRFIEDGELVRDRFLLRASGACNEGCDFRVMAQEGAGLGERMANAVKAVLEAGADSCLLMGSDLPHVRCSDVQVAELLLQGSDVVLGPGGDGGYWLVGMKEPFPALFAGKRYGHGPVLEQALETCSAQGRSVALAHTELDIDTPGDFDALCDRMRGGACRVGPRTAKAVALLDSRRFADCVAC